MAKRQVRISPEQLRQDLVSFVMHSGSVYLARMVDKNTTHVKVKNTKGHVLLLPLAEISEIWQEEKV